MLIRQYVTVKANDIWKAKVSLFKGNPKHNTLIRIENTNNNDVVRFTGLLYESSTIYSSDKIQFLELVEKVDMNYE